MQVFADGSLDLLRPIHHAWRGAAELDKVLSNFLSIKHCVKTCNLIDAHRWNATNCSYLVHGGHGQKVPALALSEVQKRDDGRLRIIRRVLAKDDLHYLVILGGKIKGTIRGIVRVIRSVLHKRECEGWVE